MRKFLFIAAAAASLLAVSCNKEVSNVSNVPVAPKGEKVRLAISLKGNGAATRATEDGTIAENTVNTVDILVFYPATHPSYPGVLDAYFHADAAAAEYELDCTTGEKLIYAVVNAPASQSLSAVADTAAFKAKVFSLTDNKTSENALSNFQMIGRTTETLVSGDNDVTINVDRVVSRIKVKKITRDFAAPAMQGKDMVINEVYISNAVDHDLFSMVYTPVAADFLHKSGVHAAATYDLWLYKSLAIFGAGNDEPFTLANGAAGAYNADNDTPADGTELVFYAMPNSIDDNIESAADADPWDVRCTKIVVKATIDSRVCYYVIPLGEIQNNKSYEISNLRLTRQGTDDPDAKVTVANCDFTLVVNPWEVVPVSNDASGDYII